MWYSYTMEYYIATKQKEILLLLTTWMDFEDIMLSEKKKREREREQIGGCQKRMGRVGKIG